MATALASSPGLPLLRSRFRSPSSLPTLHLRSSPYHRNRHRSFSASASPDLGAVDEDQKTPATIGGGMGVEESIGVLKSAAKTRRTPAAEVLSALDAIKKAKVDPSGFFETLGGTESPGRTWMLVFTAEGRLNKGRYFPLTAVQRFDAAGKRIENGVYLGPLGCLTFEGNLSWNKRILAFIFESINIKIGPFGPLRVSLGREEREPSTKDPFFIWFYADEEIAVAQGRGGGIAFWCRCQRVV
ncbi:uncharacterized protein LOC120261993 isoform X2 [Dioscorea cayenensis subsp. rotundata]|uniref:Uncharacterized protein LOC120261993 isoform X2 n=1 Tax=Dioscorea cayennensis subsp. rotundata TaxID=55577 RepID=A0AB40BFS0_DIOCR|nr:uncharacterized protein LOC120261993 isoform X2 [Dioscorea cayenensis subsp. rotundata]